MKAVILAGGLGTRFAEETSLRPKPMIEIGGKPILWHIMKMYTAHGITDFVLCCGYKGYLIKEYFQNYFIHTSDVTVDMRQNTVEVHARRTEPWRVTLVDTGESTMTGGRIKRVAEYLSSDEPFFLTYGDGVADVDIAATAAAHRAHGKLGTLTATYPPGRFGAVNIEGGQVTTFMEKPQGDGGMINGGFFVLEKAALDYIDGDDTIWEQEPLKRLAQDGELMAHEHRGFWHPMDTLRDKIYLENLWESGSAPWKTWA